MAYLMQLMDRAMAVGMWTGKYRLASSDWRWPSLLENTSKPMAIQPQTGAAFAAASAGMDFTGNVPNHHLGSKASMQLKRTASVAWALWSLSGGISLMISSK